MAKEGMVLDGKYEILKEIGRGGMSIVYLARDNRLNKQWAVKEIKNDGSKSAETLLKGLEREANILKNVDHPVLPRIVDIINQKGIIYVVMDFIEGTNLAEVLKEEGAQPQDKVIEWGRQLASALDYLHSMNPPIIYRDMKPSNVMLKPEGGVKLIDFGTAKEYTIENNADTTALGTRGYAAPEQFGDAQGRGLYKTDARTDIYNLGATLYHIVTGKNPCEPPYEMKPIRQWNPALSTGLEKIILKCTQPNPNDRYQSCSELLYALDHYTELDDSYRRANKKKMTLFAVSAALTIVAAATTIVGYTGIKRIENENYTAYIESGNEAKAEGDYRQAADEYKSAFDLIGEESEAYVKYIDLYIDSEHDVNEEGVSQLSLEDGLNVIANRIKNGYGNVDKQNEVLYKMGITYFVELEDYSAATQYFRMVDENDEDYGELAAYYGSISLILSSTNVDVSELMQNVDGFASYNISRFSNDDEEKFVNYETLGRIYTTYIQTEGVAEKAEETMTQALEDLDEYTGEDASKYLYSYNDSLSVIYETLAEEKEDETYYDMAVQACQNVINQIPADVLGTNSNNENMQAYNRAYVIKMCKIAEIYGIKGDYDEAVSIYEEAEGIIGKDSDYSNRIYAEHLNYIYEYLEDIESDPEQWTEAQAVMILTVYEEGSSVKNITNNATWAKRMATMEKLKSHDYSVSTEGTEEDSTAEDGAAGISEQMGE